MRAIVGRAAAAIVAAIVTWIASVFGIEVTAETAATWTDALTVLGIGFWGVAYAVIHKLLDRHINPADAAAPEAVEAGKAVARRL